MKIVVIFESIYGNTAAVAEAVAKGLTEYGHVDLRPVDEADLEADLLVFGAPTHAHGLSSRMTRASIEEEARKRREAGKPIDYDPTAGMRQLIAKTPRVDGVPAACFDTRFHKSRVLTGSAAKTMAKKLRERGYQIIAAPESFFVLDVEGPLEATELRRAETWGASIGALGSPG